MRALRLGVGGPVGSGKTALVAELCRRLGGEFEIAAVTNDAARLRNRMLKVPRWQPRESLVSLPVTEIDDNLTTTRLNSSEHAARL